MPSFSISMAFAALIIVSVIIEPSSARDDVDAMRRPGKGLRRLGKGSTKSPSRKKTKASSKGKSKSKIKAPSCETSIPKAPKKKSDMYPSDMIECNAILTGYIEMETDLTCLSEPGLTLGAGAVLDCKGHRLMCDIQDNVPCDFGIQMLDGAAVKNCQVEKFSRGIVMNGMNNILVDSSIQDSYWWFLDTGHGVYVDSQAGGCLTIDKVSSTLNGQHGLQVGKSNSATALHVVNSKFDSNDFTGIRLYFSGSGPKLVIEDTTMDKNVFSGMYVGRTEQVEMYGKISISHGQSDGFFIDGASVRFVDGDFQLNDNSRSGCYVRNSGKVFFERGRAQINDNRSDGFYIWGSQVTVMKDFHLESSHNNAGITVRDSASSLQIQDGGTVQTIGNEREGIKAFRNAKFESEPGSLLVSCKNEWRDATAFQGSTFDLLAGTFVCDVGDPCTAGSCADSNIFD